MDGQGEKTAAAFREVTDAFQRMADGMAHFAEVWHASPEAAALRKIGYDVARKP